MDSAEARSIVTRLSHLPRQFTRHKLYWTWIDVARAIAGIPLYMNDVLLKGLSDDPHGISPDVQPVPWPNWAMDDGLRCVHLPPFQFNTTVIGFDELA